MKYCLMIFACLHIFNFSIAQTGLNEVYSGFVSGFTNNEINSIARDKDGSIYAPIGNNVYKWTGSAWQPLGMGNAGLNANSTIKKIDVDEQKNVYATGYFTNNAGKIYVAKWNGTSWSELGPGSIVFTGHAETMVTDKNGNLYLAGTFINSNGWRYVAKWNGTSWSEVGGLSALHANGYIWSVTYDRSGNLYAAGNFTNSFGQQYIAKFDGTTWTQLGNLNPNGNILTLATDSVNNVYAAGQFTNANGYYVAKWNGITWSELAGTTGLNGNGWIWKLATDVNGRVFAGGVFYNSTIPFFGIWENGGWTKVNSPTAGLSTLITDGNGNAYAVLFNSSNSYYVGNWNKASNTWSAIGINGAGSIGVTQQSALSSLISDKYGNLLVLGNFTSPFGRYIVKWDGQYWSPVGNVDPDIGFQSLTTDTFGNIYAGVFSTVTNSNYIVKWNGAAWSRPDAGPNALDLNNAISKIIVDNSGNIYIGGSFTNSNGKYYVAKWNGTSWSQLGPVSGPGSLTTIIPITTLALDDNGNIYTGAKPGPGGVSNIMKWNGTAWTEVSSPGSRLDSEDPITTIAIDHSGNIYANATLLDLSAGWTPVIARWNGSNWNSFGRNINLLANHILSRGNNVYFAGKKLIRWNGTTFAELSNLTNALDRMNEIAIGNNNRIYSIGEFTNISFNPFFVAEHDSMFLYKPTFLNVVNKCANTPAARSKIINPPYNGNVIVAVDGNPVAYNTSDSSFQYFINGVTSAGPHQVSVRFINAINNTIRDSSYTVTPNSTLSVSINGPATFTPGVPVTITSAVVSSGSNPTYQWEDSTPTHNWWSIPGANSTTWNYLPVLGAKIRCVVTSTSLCPAMATVTSNAIQFNLLTALRNISPTEVPVSVYPNPVSRFIILEDLSRTGFTQLQVLSGTGMMVMGTIDIKRRNTIQLDLSSLPGGVYILRLTNAKHQLHYKIIKQ
jgi:trimeric autotransporter adhesin